METVRDIVVASHLVGDLSGATIDDPLSDRYKKLGCDISAVEKGSEDYNMIVNYLQKSYEPAKVGDIVGTLYSYFYFIKLQLNYISYHFMLC